MASKAAKSKAKKRKARVEGGSTKVSSVRLRNRCQICGRPHGYIGRFKVCRICFRRLALKGELPGVRKMTW